MEDIGFIEKLMAVVLAFVSMLALIKKLFSTRNHIDNTHKKVEIFNHFECNDNLQEKFKKDIEEDIEYLLNHEERDKEHFIISNLITYILLFAAFCFCIYKIFNDGGFVYLAISAIGVSIIIANIIKIFKGKN